MKTIFFTFITSIVLLSASCASQQALGGGSSPLQEATSLAANMAVN